MRSPCLAARCLTLCCAAMLLACAPAAVSQAPASTAAQSSAPHVKKTITAAVAVPITGFAPMNQSSAGGSMVTYIEVHSNGLVTSDAHGRPIPQMARERPSLDNGTMQLLDDGRMTTLWTLRDNLTWQDGSPLTADDFVLGEQVHADPKVPFTDRTAVERIASIAAVDEHSVLITWKAPFYLA